MIIEYINVKLITYFSIAVPLKYLFNFISRASVLMRHELLAFYRLVFHSILLLFQLFKAILYTNDYHDLFLIYVSFCKSNIS